ncbi:MAG TPA: hypothetical protein VNI20_02635 [Fimbriimonadaceae bacterium]|nr:hypothetical protein [Fimbriimonadaceae bacterium]
MESSPKNVGTAEVTAYSDVDENGNPKAIGVKFKTSALDNMPKDLNMKGDWFDLNGNGKVDVDMTKNPPFMETLGDYMARFDIPGNLKDIPYKFIEMNWNPMGHPPKGWSVPHFDFHFYMTPESDVDAIGLGPKGFLVSEDCFTKAIKPVDPKYVGPNYKDMQFAVGKMGNHLVDPTAPEIAKNDPMLFKYAFIYGCYDGKVTFWEPMITRDFLASGETVEAEIPLPKAYAVAGWYPTKYAIRHTDDGYTTVSIEDFVKRDAS